MRLLQAAYSELVEIYEELEHAASVHRQLGCPVSTCPSSRSRRPRTASSGSWSAARPTSAADAREGRSRQVPVWRWAHVVGAARRPRSSSSTCSSCRSGSAPARAACSRRPLAEDRGGERVSTWEDQGDAIRVRLRLRRALRRRPRAARRQGRRARRDDAARRARAGRVHDHDRRLPRLHGRGRRCRTGSRTRSPSTSRGSRRRPASASATRDDPLLVSVRSGAAVSMPGMMDTILNLGLNDVAVEGLARATGNARFAYDSYRRLIQMFGEVVDGIDGAPLRAARSRDLKRARGVQQDTDLDADDLRELVETLQGDLRARRPGAASRRTRASSCARAVRAVFDSWNTPRAQVYRRAHDDPRRPRHRRERRADGVRQQGRALGTGVCFTRDPSTGEQGLYGEFLPNAQGEDVVAGIRTPQPLEAMRERAAGRVRAARSRRCAGSSSTTATCRTSSSPSRTARSTCSRRARRSALRRRRSRPRSRWSTRA